MIRFYDSLARDVVSFEPLSPPRVGLYTCGPTVHDFAHIGNFRAYVWEDLLRRHLEYRGFDVFHVMNITDVEDKIIKKASAANVPIATWTEEFTAAFFEDSATLGLLPAHEYPRATAYVAEMIDIAKRLEERSLTYVSDGSLYFRISSFEPYGRLSGLARENLIAGARVDSDEYGKDDPADFVLWKAHRPGEPQWESPWGEGRPGWHLECSAMSMKLLGETFDLHTGGVDNKFPHHENEIAQSVGATGREFVKYWMHCAHLIVEGEKMSKSLGNFFTLRDLLERGHEPRLLRYVLISTHYRKALNFSEKALAQGRAELDRIDELSDRLALEATEETADATVASRVEQAREAFAAQLDDDLNISGALGELFKLIRELNGALDRGAVSKEDAALFDRTLADLDRIVGALCRKPDAEEKIDSAVLDLVEQRQDARAERDFSAADRIRDELLQLGFVVEDTPKGPRLKRR